MSLAFLLAVLAVVQCSFVALTDPETGDYLFTGLSGDVPERAGVASIQRCGIDVAISDRSMAVGCLGGVAIFQLQQANDVGAVLQWENTDMLTETSAQLVSNTTLRNMVFFFDDTNTQPSFTNQQTRGAYGTVVASSELYLAVGCPSCSQLLPEDPDFAQGRVFIYSREEATAEWEFHSVLTPGTVGEHVFFGVSLAFGDNNELAVGALYPSLDGAVYIYTLTGNAFTLAQNLTGYGGFAVDLKRRTLAIGSPERDVNFGIATVFSGTPGTFAPIFGPANISRDAQGMACGYSVAIDQPEASSTPAAVIVGCPSVDASNDDSTAFLLRNLTGDVDISPIPTPASLLTRDPRFVGWDVAAHSGTVVIGVISIIGNDGTSDFPGGAFLLTRDAADSADGLAEYNFQFTDFGTSGNSAVATVLGDVKLNARPGCTWCIEKGFYNNTYPQSMGSGVAVSGCGMVVVTNQGRTGGVVRVGGVVWQNSEVQCEADVRVTGEDYVPPFAESAGSVVEMVLF